MSARMCSHKIRSVLINKTLPLFRGFSSYAVAREWIIFPSCETAANIFIFIPLSRIPDQVNITVFVFIDSLYTNLGVDPLWTGAHLLLCYFVMTVFYCSL